jgi:hypothetical protein
MMGLGRRVALALAFAACLIGAAPATDDNPSTYAVRVPVTADRTWPVQRLAIPAQVLAAARTADLSDLRVFDAAGKPVPIARIAPAQKPLHRASLPVLPILGSVNALNVKGVTLRLDEEGRVGVAQVVGTPAGSTTAKVLGVLLDARRIHGAARNVIINAGIPEAQPVTFSVEAGVDLKEWRAVGEMVSYRPTASDDGNDISLPLGDATLNGEYLRITWHGASRLLSPVTIRRATLVTRAETTATGSSIEATAPPPTDAHISEFALPFAAPASTIRIVPRGGEVIVPIRILGRDSREQPWALLGEGTAARQGTGQAKGGILLGNRAYRMLRIEADPHSAGFSAAPAITFDFARREIVFLAVGKPPYTLAAGRAATTAAYLPLASIMTQATDGRLGIATIAAAARDSVMQLEPIGKSGARQALLWGLLIGATAVLGSMAWLLWRRDNTAK